ncbi:MAG: TIGR02147 family protein [Myxococcota bacterium]
MFSYLDYRAFLRDTYTAKKAEQRGFSFRSFSRRAGLQSPNHLKRVIDGERNLNGPMAIRYAAALQMGVEEAAYFGDLVAFSQADSDAERNAAYERLQSNRGYRRAQKLDIAHAAYTSSWYLPVIREMVALEGFRADPAWIGRHLLPAVSANEVSKALDILVDLGMLRWTDTGGLEQADAVVTTGPETRGLHVRNFHRAMLERAAMSMEIVPAPQRDISALTFGADDTVLGEVKRRVQEFRKDLLAYVTDHGPGRRIVQLNFQLFPLSHAED